MTHRQNTATICPKCGYTRKPTDRHVMAGTCPSCGIAYNKFRPYTQTAPAVTSHPTYGLKSRIKAQFLYTPDITDPLSLWWRGVLTALFALWGAAFIWHGVDWTFIGGSFLHNANLPFHEFGHVLFSPFGRFMAILGGSLFQILMPLIALLAFSIQQRDNFAASIMLWWCGQNFVDVAPYIKDAPDRAIPLIRGMGEEAHDWGNLLTMTHSLDSATWIANMSFFLGSVIMVGAIVWAAVLLKKMHTQLNAPEDSEP